jgi:phosphatidylglycerophosphate synthase
MDVFGDRYLTVVSLLYAGFRGVSLSFLAVILLREIYSVAMRMVQIDGRGVMMSNPKVGGAVHIVIAIGTLNLVCRPGAMVTFYAETPFLAVAVFYLIYFPWTLVRSWSTLTKSIRSDLERAGPPASGD